jgi:hypothetical protein
MRRAIEQAERDARREARQNEKEARKRAEEIVVIAESEWKTIWADPHLKLSGQSRIDRRRDEIELTQFAAESTGIRVTAGGRVADVSSRAIADLQGTINCDFEQLQTRLQETVGRHIHLQGTDAGSFTVQGPLRNTISATAQPLVPLELGGRFAAGWQHGDLFGLQAGPGTIDLRLSDGVLAMQPLDLALSGGELKLAPRLLLTGRPATLVIPAGPLVRNVELSQDVCDSWLKFIAPILSEATRVEGRFSVDMHETRLPLSDPAVGQFGGRLEIATAQVLPGPLFAEIGAIIGQLESAVRLGGGDLLGLQQPLVKIENQRVEFRMQDRRIHSTPLEFNVRNVVVRTRGSVGVDQTLDLVAEIILPAEWVRRVPFLARLQGKPLEVPIRGTLHRPRLDGKSIGNAWQQFGLDALDSLLNGGFQKLFDR